MDKRVIIVGIIVSVVLLMPKPVLAVTERYDETPYCTYGSWNSSTNKSTEQASDWTHKLVMTWDIYNVPTNGDAYWVLIDYESVSPTGHNYEGLIVSYRWGGSGSWKNIVTLRLTFGAETYKIDDATSSYLQIKFEDESRLWFEGQHTWEFGSVPILLIY
jgi:hypothetical protein